MKKYLSILLGAVLTLSAFSILPAEELVSEEIVPENAYVYQMPELQEERSDFEELDDGITSSSEEISDSLPIVSATDPASTDRPSITGYYNSVKGADIRWKKVNGATGYILYRQRSAEGVKSIVINDANAVQYYDGDIRDNCWGRVYVYYICAVYGSEKGPESSKVTLQRLAPMKITKATGNTSGKIDLTWACTTNSNKAEGYEIQYATSWTDLSNRNGSFQAVTVNGRNNLSKTLTGLVNGKNYHIRIRSYVNYTHSVTGKTTKTWSQYSDVVQVKIPAATPTPTPTVTPKPTTAPQTVTGSYVLNKNSHIFHYSWCGSVKKMSARNRWDYAGTRDQVVAMGYKPCSNCKP